MSHHHAIKSMAEVENICHPQWNDWQWEVRSKSNLETVPLSLTQNLE